MRTYRIYFMDGRSIVAADTLSAETGMAAAGQALDRLETYPWFGKLQSDNLEVWDGAALLHAASIGGHRPSPAHLC